MAFKIFPSNRRGIGNNEDNFATRQKAKGLFRRASYGSPSTNNASTDLDATNTSRVSAPAAVAVAAAAASMLLESDGGPQQPSNAPQSKSQSQSKSKSQWKPKRSKLGGVGRVFKRSGKPTLKDQFHRRHQQQHPEEEGGDDDDEGGEPETIPASAAEAVAEDDPRKLSPKHRSSEDDDDDDEHDGDSTLETSPTPVPRTTKEYPATSEKPLTSVPDLPELSMAAAAVDGEGAAVTPKNDPSNLLAPRTSDPPTAIRESTNSNGDHAGGDDAAAAAAASGRPPVISIEFLADHSSFELPPMLPLLDSNYTGRLTNKPPPRAGEWDDDTLESHSLKNNKKKKDWNRGGGNGNDHSEGDGDATIDSSLHNSTLSMTNKSSESATDTDAFGSDAVARMKPLIERAARLALLQNKSCQSLGGGGGGVLQRNSSTHTASTKPSTVRRSFSEYSRESSVPSVGLGEVPASPGRTAEQRLRQRYHRYNRYYQHHNSKRALLASLDDNQAAAVPAAALVARPSLLGRHPSTGSSPAAHPLQQQQQQANHRPSFHSITSSSHPSVVSRNMDLNPGSGHNNDSTSESDDSDDDDDDNDNVHHHHHHHNHHNQPPPPRIVKWHVVQN